MQVLQRYFTPHSAAMAEYALANAVINRVKGQAKHPDEAHLSPIASLSSREGEQSRLLWFACISVDSVCTAKQPRQYHNIW